MKKRNLFSSKREARKRSLKKKLSSYTNVRFHLDESIRGSKTDQKKCFQGSPLDPLVWQTREDGEREGGRVHNSISSRWPPIKADEWEPFNGPSVNLHPWPYTFLPLLFNPFQHPFSISGTRNIPASLGNTSFLSRVSLLVNDARSLLSPSAMKLVPEFRHLPRCNLPLSTLGRLLVSLVTLKRAYVIRQPRENKEHHPRGF